MSQDYRMIMIPAEKVGSGEDPAPLALLNGNRLHSTSSHPVELLIRKGGFLGPDDKHIPQHLYAVATNTDIVQGDWCMITDEDSSFYGKFEQHLGSHNRTDQWNKILATTNPELTGEKAVENDKGNVKNLLHLQFGIPKILPAVIKSFIEDYNRINTSSRESTKKTIIELEQERLEWALEIFPKATQLSSLDKLVGEVEEIKNDISKGIRQPLEYADVLMCLFDSAARQQVPITPQEIFDAFEEKLKINKARNWVKNDDNTYSHVKVKH